MMSSLTATTSMAMILALGTVRLTEAATRKLSSSRAAGIPYRPAPS
jgi:hypothetical protein